MKAKNIIFYGLIAAMMALALTGCPNDTDPSTQNPNTEQTQFDKDGYDKDGYDKDGFNKQGYDREGYNESGYDKKGYDRDGYNAQGYDRQGIDADGYDRDGFKNGYDRDGYDAQGYDRQGYDAQGYNRKGLDADGYDEQGFKDGYDRQGLDAQGYDRDGYKNGYDKAGYDVNGFHKDTGIHKVTGTRYNPAGYDKDGNLITEPDPNKPVPPLVNINVPRHDVSLSISVTKKILGTIATQLAAQSGEIADKFDIWYNALRTWREAGNDVGRWPTIVSNITINQQNMSNYIANGTSASGIKQHISTSGANLVSNIVAHVLLSQSDANLLKKQIEAFQAAHVIKQRIGYGTTTIDTKAQAEANFTQICQELAQMGGPNISVDDIQGAINTLRLQLEASMPEELGPYRNYLVQQWEDFAEFDGLVSDLIRRGPTTEITRNASLSRANIQTANGEQMKNEQMKSEE